MCSAAVYVYCTENEAGAGPNVRNVLFVGVTAGAPWCPEPVNMFSLHSTFMSRGGGTGTTCEMQVVTNYTKLSDSLV